MTPGEISFEHLYRLSDDTGLFEHARGALARREHGYCLDDVARGLLVLSREPYPTGAQTALVGRYLAFVAHAQGPDGSFHNRLGFDRRWEDAASTGDWWGRALWGLGGTVAGNGPQWQRDEALHLFELGQHLRSAWPRPLIFAALGAADVIRALPGHAGAREMLSAVLDLPRPPADLEWPWPEPRLTYANASWAEALLAAGDVLGDRAAVDDGLRMSAWLVDASSARGHLSVSPAAGRGPHEHHSGFDQQPIEVAAIADACARAYILTGDSRWRVALGACVGWFLGANDSHTAMHDPLTGGGYDGLEAGGCNINQGAESTIAWLLTQQHARVLDVRPVLAATR
jgi:hypothetical protein